MIGLGAIGVLVANTAIHLGMEVYGYDPYVSVDSAWKLSRNIHHAKTVDELYKECDYLTIHVPALPDTKGMINKDAISLMKKDVVVLNFARDTLVDSEAMVDALIAGNVKRYVTDFPTPEIAGVKGAIDDPASGSIYGRVGRQLCKDGGTGIKRLSGKRKYHTFRKLSGL